MRSTGPDYSQLSTTPPSEMPPEGLVVVAMFCSTNAAWKANFPRLQGMRLGPEETFIMVLQPLDHDEFGSSRSKVINVIDSNILAQDSREKPVSTFRIPR